MIKNELFPFPSATITVPAHNSHLYIHLFRNYIQSNQRISSPSYVPPGFFLHQPDHARTVKSLHYNKQAVK